MKEPPLDTSRRGLDVAVEGIGPARIHCENEHAVWVQIEGGRSPVGYRRAQVRTADGQPLTWKPPVIHS